MAPMKPLFRTVLQECLDKRLYPGLLYYVFADVFFVNLKYLSKPEWTPEYARHYVHWDRENARAGFPDREPRSDMKYYSKSRHRYQQALKRMVELGELQLVSIVGLAEGNAYRFLPGTRSLPSPSQESPVSSPEVYCDNNPGFSKVIPPQDIMLCIRVSLTRETETAVIQNNSNLLGTIMDIVGILDDDGNVEPDLDDQGNFENQDIAISEKANLSSSYEPHKKILLEYPMRDIGQTVPNSCFTSSHPMIDKSLDALKTPKNGCHETLVIKDKDSGHSVSRTHSPAAKIPVNMEPDTGTLQTAPNSSQEKSLLANSPAAQDEINKEPDIGTLQTPPNCWKDMSLFAHSLGAQDEIDMEPDIGTLQTPPHGWQEMYLFAHSPGAQDENNMEPDTGTLQTAPNGWQEMSLYAHSPVPQDAISMEPDTGTLQTPPNGCQDMSLFAHSPVPQDAISMEPDTGTLQTPPKGCQEMSLIAHSPAAQVLVNTKPHTGPFQMSSLSVKPRSENLLLPADPHGQDSNFFFDNAAYFDQQANSYVTGDNAVSVVSDKDLSFLDDLIISDDVLERMDVSVVSDKDLSFLDDLINSDDVLEGMDVSVVSDKDLSFLDDLINSDDVLEGMEQLDECKDGIFDLIGFVDS